MKKYFLIFLCLISLWGEAQGLLTLTSKEIIEDNLVLRYKWYNDILIIYTSTTAYSCSFNNYGLCDMFISQIESSFWINYAKKRDTFIQLGYSYYKFYGTYTYYIWSDYQNNEERTIFSLYPKP